MPDSGREPFSRGEPPWQQEATAYAHRISDWDDRDLLCLLTALNTELASLREEALPRRGVRVLRPEAGPGRSRQQGRLLLRREVVRRALIARGLLPAP